MPKQGGKKATLLSGVCPDRQCQTKLYFPSYQQSIECTGCGQRHEPNHLKDVSHVEGQNIALGNILHSLFIQTPKEGVRMVLFPSSFPNGKLNFLLLKYLAS